MYAIIGYLDSKLNREIIYSNKSLAEVKIVLELINSIDEYGYFEDMDNNKIELIIEQLTNHCVQWWVNEDFLPELKDAKIIQISDVDERFDRCLHSSWFNELLKARQREILKRIKTIKNTKTYKQKTESDFNSMSDFEFEIKHLQNEFDQIDYVIKCV